MSLMSDLKILYHMALRPIRGKSHAERLESFYSGQAEAYDDFRKRLLQGREGLWQKIGSQPGATWVDMGGGTGANLEFFGPEILKLKKVYVVDLAGSLLKVAKSRAEKNQWSHVETVEADATKWQPSEGQVDVVTFSYSLTMIPDWFAAIDNALAMLKPGGMIGVVDFYVSRKHPDDELKKHRWSTRSFWPIWFANDNVFPSSEHLPYLRYRCQTQWLSENRAKVPYLPLVRTPYYQYIGLKKS